MLSFKEIHSPVGTTLDKNFQNITASGEAVGTEFTDLTEPWEAAAAAATATATATAAAAATATAATAAMTCGLVTMARALIIAIILAVLTYFFAAPTAHCLLKWDDNKSTGQRGIQQRPGSG